MPPVKITENVYSVGVLNPALRVFDIVMSTEYGTSYNAYLARGEKTALVETCHRSFFEEYVENISAVCKPEEIDFIILNHTEPDHSGALAGLLELCPHAEIYCSQAASLFLKAITNRPDITLHVVKDGETLDLGGLTLQFISAPFLHWPDSIFTYLPEENLLFTCDFLGSHYCEPRVLDRHITYEEAYEASFKGYYEAIFGPFPAYVRQGLEKIRALTCVDTICPSHGPVLTKGERYEFAMEKYAKWSTPLPASKDIPIFYVSAYGCTRALAEAAAEGVREARPGYNVELYDIIRHSLPELGGILNASAAFLIGTPTLNRDALPPVWQLLSMTDAVNIAKRPVAVFGSYGWSGEATGAVAERLKALKLNVFPELLKVNFVPSEVELEKAKTFGRAFGKFTNS